MPKKSLFLSNFSKYLGLDDIWFNVLEFLPLKDLIYLFETSKQFRNTINCYFKTVLIKKNIDLAMNSNYCAIYAQLFCKTIIRLQIGTSKQKNKREKSKESEGIKNIKKECKVFDESLNSYKDIKFYSLFYFTNKILRIQKKIDSSIFELREIVQFVTNENILFGINVTNSLVAYSYEQKIEKNIDISHLKSQKIKKIVISEEYLLIVSQSDDSDDVTIINIDNLVLNEQISENKIKKLELKDFKIKEIHHAAIGKSKAYIISQENIIYEINLINFYKKEGIDVKLMESLKNKKIQKVFAGFDSFFALEEIKQEIFRKWDNEQILLLAKKIGMDDYLNIIKYSKITGKDFNNCSIKYLKDTLGLKNEILISKLRKEINNNSQEKRNKQILYAWGDNSFKQLGLSKNTNKTISQPEIVSLPLDIQNGVDSVESICIFEDCTIFNTVNQKVFYSDSKIMKPESQKGKKKTGNCDLMENSCWIEINIDSLLTRKRNYVNHLSINRKRVALMVEQNK